MSVVHDPSGTPTLIKRNTILLASTQAFTGAGMQMVFSISPLIVLALLGSPILAGLSVATQAFSRFLAAYPFGRITDAFGRRAGLLTALSIGLVGTLLVGAAVAAGTFLGFFVGLLVFGIGINGAQQLRLAAADMYPPHRRAEALGYVLSGSLVGVVLSPLFMALSTSLAPGLGMDPLALPWFLVPLFIIPAMFLLSRVHPDPRDIARDLRRYYPTYVPSTNDTATVTGGFGVRRFLEERSRRVALVSNVAAQGNMSMAMVTTPLMLAHHGTSLPLITLSMAFHVAGMFGPSIPVGRLADRYGRRPLMLAGVLIEAVGSIVVALSSDHLSGTIGVTLVGAGWCAINVSATALIVDSSPTLARGRAIGVNDSLAAAAGLTCALLVGPLTVAFGLPAVGLLAVALMVPAAVMILRMRDPRPVRGVIVEAVDATAAAASD